MTDRIEERQPLGAHKRRQIRQSKDVKRASPPKSNPDVLAAQRKKNEALICLLREWMADESGEQEREWPIIKKALEEDRPSYRRLFSD